MKKSDVNKVLFLCLFLIICFGPITVLIYASDLKSHTPYAEAIESSREAVKAMLVRASVPGVGVAVAVDGEIVWAEGFGLSDVEQRVAVTNDTRFAIGSISKSLTMTLFARLFEKGLVDFDTPVEHYLPEFPHKNQGITVRLIAGHLSGLGDEFDKNNFYTGKHYGSTLEALKEIFKEPLQSKAGERHFYSTSSYTIIAGIIERVSGQNFLSAMKDYVLMPLHLESIIANERSGIIPNRTAFYVQNDEKKTVNAPYFDPSFKWAGAGYLSTATDMARFANAIMEPGFLKESALKELLQPLETTSGEKTEFALGWRVGVDKKGRRIIHQPGGGAGISCWLFLYPNERIVIVLLSNQTGAPVGGRALDTIADSFIAATNQMTSSR